MSYMECGSSTTHDAHKWGSGRLRAWCPGWREGRDARRPAPAEILRTGAVADGLADLDRVAFLATALVQKLAETARRREVELDWAQAEFGPSYDPTTEIDRIFLSVPIKKEMRTL